jgi:hypothetical protein
MYCTCCVASTISDVVMHNYCDALHALVYASRLGLLLMLVAECVVNCCRQYTLIFDHTSCIINVLCRDCVL